MRLETESSLMVVPEASSERVRAGHVTAVLAAVLGALLAMPTAAAHAGGTDVYLGGVHVTQWHALLPLGLGIGTVLASAYLPRVLRPAYSKYALYGVFAGLAIAVLGAIGLVQLSPVEWYATDPVIPRAIHDPLMLVVGLAIAVASLLGGRYRWPTRPRYAGLGILLGAWVAYPGLMAGFGVDSLTHPLGYLVVLSLPIALGYILWRDARGLLAGLWADRLARRFGLGVGALGVIFFLFSTGMLTIIPDEGTGVSLAERIVATLPVASPLVTWPAIEFWLPSLPLGGMVFGRDGALARRLRRAHRTERGAGRLPVAGQGGGQPLGLGIRYHCGDGRGRRAPGLLLLWAAALPGRDRRARTVGRGPDLPALCRSVLLDRFVVPRRQRGDPDRNPRPSRPVGAAS
jgi:hypothetical protein